MYHYAGYQSPVWRDKGGNVDDGYDSGRMDCIDHSTNTTRFLQLVERRGILKFYQVLEPVKRGLFFTIHMAAQIAERTGFAQNAGFAVDSWFFDPGHPAEIYPLAEWLNGRRPSGR